MTKNKGKTGNRIIIASGIIGVAFLYMGLTSGGTDTTIFEDFIGLSIIDANSQRVFCDGANCVWNWRSFNPVTATGTIKEKIDLALFNIDEPIIVTWRIDIKMIAPECESNLDALRMNIEINDGVDTTFPSVAGVTQSVDISRFVTTNIGELEIQIGTEFCFPIDPNTQNFSFSNGEFPPSSPTILFTQFGAQSSGEIEEIIEEMMMEQPIELVECLGCSGDVISMAESQQMCPLLDCSPTPPTNGNGNGGFPMLTVETGLATQIFVVLGAIIVAVVGIAIFIRRRSAPITDF